MLNEFLADRRAAILDRWLSLILDTYPSEVGRFLRKEKDRFANPVGQTIAREIEAIYDGILRGAEPDELAPALDGIVRIRAVQDFRPSQAVSFMFLLKRAVREDLEEVRRGEPLPPELFPLESRIDALAVRAFDIHSECREKMYEIRAKEIKNRTWVLLERMNRAGGKGDDG
jgi:hypothetical protein